jgi:hypothetical protein
MAYPQYQRPFPSSRELTRGDPFLELHRGMNRMFDDVFRSSLWPLTAAQQVGSMMAPVRAGAEEQRRQAPDRQRAAEAGCWRWRWQQAAAGVTVTVDTVVGGVVALFAEGRHV